MNEADRQDLYKLLIARQDVNGALSAARELAKMDLRNPLWTPLQSACVVSYARPFTRNRPFGSLSPEWSQFRDPRFQELHERLLTLRHKTIVHSDSEIRRATIHPPRSLRPPVIGGRSRAFEVSVSGQVLPPKHVAGVHDLCIDLGQRLQAAIQAHLDQIDPDTVPAMAFDLLTLAVVGREGSEVHDKT